MRYGLPYKGSKNGIAEWVISVLPKADTFVDLFFGGGALTHAALLSGKYKQFICNDIDGRLIPLFLDCCYGKYTVENHTEWISRKEFFERKDDDAYIALVWSFGNNGKDYLYSKEREPFKKAMHYACFFDDLSLFEELGIKISRSNKKGAYERYLEYKKYFENQDAMRNNEIERLQNMENITRLQSLQSLQSDYQSVVIPDGSLIYADPPYSDTNCGKYQGFDSQRFYEWARKQDNIFISEYNMPDDFIPYAQIEKTVLSAANGNSQKNMEKIFTNQRTWDKLTDRQKEVSKQNFAKQITLEDMFANLEV